MKTDKQQKTLTRDQLIKIERHARRQARDEIRRRKEAGTFPNVDHLHERKIEDGLTKNNYRQLYRRVELEHQIRDRKAAELETRQENSIAREQAELNRRYPASTILD